jgi:hypothetical protein
VVPSCSFDYEISQWTGFILNQTSSTFALGNDAVQLAEALIDVYREPRACGVTFLAADLRRGRGVHGHTNGFSSAFPSLASGRIAVRDQQERDATHLRRVRVHYGERYNLFKPMQSVVLAVMNTALYERMLRLHLWPHLEAYSQYRGPPLDDSLVIYLRSDDAAGRVGSWFHEWKFNPPHCSFFERCISHSGLRKLVVVTRVAEGPLVHPLLPGLRSKFGDDLRVQSGSLAEDFATLVHAQHICLDFSTLGIVAAMLNRELRSIYLQRIFSKHDSQPDDDLGWTVPATAQRAVHIIEPGNSSSCPAPRLKPLSPPGSEGLEEMAMRSNCRSVKLIAKLKCGVLPNISTAPAVTSSKSRHHVPTKQPGLSAPPPPSPDPPPPAINLVEAAGDQAAKDRDREGARRDLAEAANAPRWEARDAKSIAIVQWTHTLKMKPMLLTARRQVMQQPHAEHHVVLSACGHPNATRCSELLAQAAPLVENVTCNTPAELVAELPAFSTLHSVFSSKSKSARPKELGINHPRWCWNSCDSPYLLWYKRTGVHLKHVRFFWFLEWDVVWTGDIVSIFTAWNTLSTTTFEQGVDTVAPLGGNSSQLTKYETASDHDLLCANPSWANLHWGHLGKRDKFLVPSDSAYRCVTALYRMTHRLLRSVVAVSRYARSAMFCELRAPSVCALQSSWCKMRSFFDSQRSPLLYTWREVAEREKAHNLSDAAIVGRARHDWVLSYAHATTGGVTDDQLSNLEEPMLYHAYKWAPNATTKSQGASFQQMLERRDASALTTLRRL